MTVGSNNSFIDRGMARDFVSGVSQVRRDLSLNLNDRYTLLLDTLRDIKLLNVLCRNISEVRMICAVCYVATQPTDLRDFSFSYYDWFCTTDGVAKTTSEATWTGKVGFLKGIADPGSSWIKLDTANSWRDLLDRSGR